MRLVVCAFCLVVLDVLFAVLCFVSESYYVCFLSSVFSMRHKYGTVLLCFEGVNIGLAGVKVCFVGFQ